VPSTVHPHGLATVIVAMLRGVALQSLIDDDVDLEAARTEIEQLLTSRLQKEQR
jgi:ubiquinone biosynthesis protein COQ9